MHSFLNHHSPPSSLALDSPFESHRRDSHCPTLSTSCSTESDSSTNKSQSFIKAEEEDKRASLPLHVPEGKKRKFILVDDLARGTRVRVHVELDNIKMEEMPDFHLQKNSVFPRQFCPRQMYSPVSPRKDQKGWSSSGDTEGTGDQDNLAYVPLLDGSETQLPVPGTPKDLQGKECALNELGYRMSWRQAKTFNERTLFMQKSRKSRVGNPIHDRILTRAQLTPTATRLGMG